MYPGLAENPTCSVEIIRQPGIKLPPRTTPKMIVCAPIGNKEEEQIFDMPAAGACGREGCECPWHGKSLTKPIRNQGLVPFEWAMNQMQLLVPLGTTVYYLAEKNKLAGPARDLMTRRALEIDPEFVFFWDDDVILPQHVFYNMQNAMARYPDIGALTGVVCTRQDPTEPMVYRRQGDGAWWGFNLDPNAEPENIFAAGGGCLMVRTEALKKMTPPYWTEVHASSDDLTKPGNSTWGHDFYFLEKLRAESGMRVAVMGSVLCGHWDTDRQKLYELPKDSPPYRALQQPKPKPPLTVEICPPLSEDYLETQLKLSNHGRRIFVVSKQTQAEEAMHQVLGSYFDGVQIIDSDENWVAVTRGLRNGGNHAVEGSSDRSDQHGGPGGDSGGGGL